MALDRPFDNGRVQTANVAVSASTVSENILVDLIFMFSSKPLYFRHFRPDETAEMEVSDQRGTRKTAELHTSGAKRTETRRGGAKW